MNHKRLDYEGMRILGIFLVVFNHTQYRGYFLYQLPESGMVNTVGSLFLAALCKAAVPLFFMVSGGLLLERQETISQLLKKRVLRMALVLLLFSGVVYLEWLLRGTAEDPGVSDFICRLWGEGISVPYWYLYTYLGILLLLPILRPAAKAMPDSAFRWLLLIQLLYYGVLVPVGALTPLGTLNPYFATGLLGVANAWGTPFMASQGVFYLLMGYYFAHRFHWDRIGGKQLVMLGLLAAAALGAMMWLTWRDLPRQGGQGQEYFSCYLSIVVIFLYALCRQLNQWHPVKGKAAGLVETMGSCVFGTYLLEGILRRLLDGVYLSLEPKLHVLPACLVWVGAVVLCGMAVTWCLKKLPGLRKLL